MDKEATTMSVREMRELLGIKKTDSYWLLKKNCFEVVKIAGKMRIVKKSFENWYAGQTHYRKVSGEEPGKQLETEFYSAQKIGEMLGIKTCSVYDLIQSAGLRTVVIDNRLRVPREVFDTWYAGQNHYRVAQDRERDRLLEESSMTVPELGRLLGLDRRQAWKLHTKVKSAFVTIRVAGKPRVTKQSFESWYQNQTEYTKVTIQSPDGFTCAVRNKPFYPLNEASQLSGIPERDLYRMIQSHDLRGKKIGKSWYIRQEEMQDVMNQRKGT